MNPQSANPVFEVIPVDPQHLAKHTLCVGIFTGWTNRTTKLLHREDVLHFANTQGFDLGHQHHLNAIVRSQRYDMSSFFNTYPITGIVALGTLENRTGRDGVSEKYSPILLPPSRRSSAAKSSHMGLISHTLATAAYEPNISGFVLIKK